MTWGWLRYVVLIVFSITFICGEKGVDHPKYSYNIKVED